MNDQILKALNWRYATKQFIVGKRIPQDQLDTLLEVIRIAPSSVGVQPWKFVVVNDPKVREQLKAAAYGQPQITDASNLIVFCYRTDVDAKHIDHVTEVTAKARGMKVEDLKGYHDMMMGVISKSPEALAAWSARQSYIPLGMLLEAAALMGIDACPMEGFDPKQFDEILGLKEKHLSSVGVCALGYRSPDDKYALAAKARLPKGEVIVTI